MKKSENGKKLNVFLTNRHRHGILMVAIGTAVLLCPKQAMSRTWNAINRISYSRPKVAFFYEEPMKSEIKKCLFCGNKVISYISQPRKYCSHSCYASDSCYLEEKKCEQCGEVFKPKHSHNRFCSVRCFGLHERGANNPHYGRGIKTGIYKHCEECRKEYYVLKSRIDISKFCSIKCLQIFNGRLRAAEKIKKYCSKCNEVFIVKDTKMGRSRKYCSHRCSNEHQKEKMLKMYCGEDNPNWRGGISKLPYSFKFDKKLKSQIRKRDDHQCQLCNKLEKDYFRALDVHHIDYDKQNCEPDNLISLCVKCNSTVNFNREYWRKFLHTKVKKIIMGGHKRALQLGRYDGKRNKNGHRRPKKIKGTIL